MQAQPMPSCSVRPSVRPSVCLSVTFVDSVKTNKRIFKMFSPSGSHAVLVIPHQTSWRYSDGEPPNEGVNCRCGWQKSRFWANIWLHRMLSTLQPVRRYQRGAAGPWQVVTFVSGSKRRSLLIAGDDDEMFMTKSINVTPQTTEHLIVRSDKSVAYINVTNNKRLRLTFCTIEANYWQTRSIALPPCDSRATCF